MTPIWVSKPSSSGEELIQGLLSLVVAAHDRADASRLPQRVQLVDEDDARSLLLGLGEEVAHARGSDADEHLDGSPSRSS